MATNNRATVVGVFDNRTDAERAVDELHRAGFTDSQIGFAARDGETLEGGRPIEGSDTGEAGEGAAKGVVGGGIVGGVLGALATGLIPGVGPVIAGGLLAGIIGGAVIGGAAGGIFGALVGSMGVPEDEARYYDEEFKSGRTLVTVTADGRYDEAYRILQNAGAYDFQTRDAGTRTAMTGATAPAPATTRTTTSERERPVTRATTPRDDASVELHEEQLIPRKEVEQTGQVGIRKDVVSQERSVDVPVTREEVVVERHAVEPRPATRPIGQEQTIEVPVREERVDLDKQAVVYEEVEIGKRQVQDTERVSGTVRREEARIEREGDVNLHESGRGSTGFRSWDEIEPTYRQEWERRYGTSGMRWQDVEPYRRYSYEMANDPRYQGRDWSDAESDLRTNYGEWSRRNGYRYDENAWDRFKDQVRSAWEETRDTARGRR